MLVKASHTYEAGVDDVMTMLRDREATVAKYEGMGHRDVKILECSSTAGELRIRSSRIVDVDLPGFAKKVLRPTNTMTQTDVWQGGESGTWEGTFVVEVQGAPVHLSGTMHLVPSGSTTEHQVTVDVAVKVPIIGGRIADWAAKNDVRRTLDAEFAFGDQWLAEHRP